MSQSALPKSFDLSELNPGVFDYNFFALGGPNQIRLCAETKATADSIAAAMITEVQRVEAKFSRYQEDSVLSRINNCAGKHAVAVDKETAALLDYADNCFKQSDGLFDVTSGVLRKAWDFKSATLPSQTQIDVLLPLIGWDKVEWKPPHIKLPKVGMQIDFGGIGKEYAVDRAVTVAHELGMISGFVNLGGDVGVLGPKPDGSKWHIGIVHPRTARETIATVAISKGAVATSGDYERFMELDGKRYCHILNPRTGWPVSELQSVSVVAESCILAGSLSTMAMLYGMEQGRALLDENKMTCLIVDRLGKLSTIRLEE